MNSYQSIKIPTLQAVKIIHSQYISENKSLGEDDEERWWNNYLSLNVMMMSFSFMRALLFDFFFVAFERDSWGFSWDKFSTESCLKIDYMLTCYLIHKTYLLIYIDAFKNSDFLFLGSKIFTWLFWILLKRYPQQ